MFSSSKSSTMVQAKDAVADSTTKRPRNPILSSLQELDDAKREKIVTNLIANGPLESGHALPFCQPQEIPWFDEEVYEAGRRFVNDYKALILILNLVEFIGSAAGRPITPGFFRNGNYFPKHIWIKRSISTIKKFTIGYTDDLRDPTSEGIKHLKFARKMHELYADVKPAGANLLPFEDEKIPQKYHELAALIRDALAHVDTTGGAGEDVITWRPAIPFSQFTVMIAQLSMITPFYTVPLVSKNVPEDGARGYIYIWALYSRMMGLRDEFNMALTPDRELYNKLFKRISAVMYQRIDATGAMFLSHALDDARMLFGYMASSKAILYYGMNTYFEDKQHLLWNSLNFLEKAQATLLNLLFSFYFKVPVFRWIFNHVFWGYWLLLAKLVVVHPKEREDNKKHLTHLREIYGIK